MALPLAVQSLPPEAPFAFPIGAEAVVLYPTDEAEDVSIDAYFEGLQDIEVEVYGGGFTYTTSIVAPGTPPSTELDEYGNPCIPGTPAITFPVFCETPGLSAVFFRWLDVASFFWYWPPGDVVEEFTPPDGTPGVEVGQPCPPPPADVCLPGNDALPLGPSLGPAACPVDSVFWDGGLVIWDSGLTCWIQDLTWDPEVDFDGDGVDRDEDA